ncbi:DUF937 domain-containing protein [Micropruina sonneratiae]|uniref:DUF937 domain-containing protein n=1 Tax=Micropruina sonneratiae TaxID=2986940 RepID=UPI0022269099|nr:DUF937 domain-containing protein [Micropruina sp. KQZ13P-5]MCW3157056.1 DUF937 domain-containing protein [Micropruina sp. KQZ13P-5]
MSAADEIIADLPMDQLAQQLGTDQTTAEQAVRDALPALFGGLQTNVATDDAGPQSLAQALTQHSDPQFFEGGIDLNQVDTDDGQAIVRHIFANSPEQAQVLQASSAGGTGGLLQKLLPILAPIVMAYIAKKLNMGASQQSGSTASGQAGSASQGGLGDLLGPILGGMFGGAGAAAGSSGSAGGGFGDILGQILGGQAPQATQSQAEQGTGQQFPGGGQAQQPQFNPTGPDDGQVRMPTAEENPADEGDQQQQQRSDGGIGDILGGLFGR